MVALTFVEPSLADWHRRDDAIMGTRIHVEVWHEDGAIAERAIDVAMAEMRRIDVLMSSYAAASPLSQLNRDAALGWSVADVEIYNLTKLSVVYSELSSGAFDVTFAAVGQLYDLRAHVRPTREKIAEKLPAVGYDKLEFDDVHHALRYRNKDTQIGLGGIAKGYAVDNAIAAIKHLGVESALVMAGGDTYVLGDKRGRPWNVGIKHPRRNDEVFAIVPLVESAISTSGDYERFFDEGGIRYHHIIDTKTGDSARLCQSVTIIAPNATTSDALSTTVFVLGPEKGMALVEKLPGIDAVIIDALGKMTVSAGLKNLSVR